MGILIGLDIGTTKLCAVAFDAESGSMGGVEDAPNDAQLPCEPDAAEQDASAIIGKAVSLLARLVQDVRGKSRSVDAIGVTGQMHGVVLADGEGVPVTPLVTWQDGRGNRPFAGTGHSYADELARRLGPAAVEASGCSPASGFGAVTLLRMAAENCLPRNVTALTMHDLVVRALCGVAATDPTDGASWGVFDVRHGNRWLPEARQAVGLRDDVGLPAIAPTGSLAGSLLPSVASAVGVAAGTPVAVAIGDNQASFFGSVPSVADSVLFNLGTGGQMSVAADTFQRATGLDTRPLVEGQWLMVGASLCGGRAYQILRDFFAAVGRDLFGASDTTGLYAAMGALADASDEDCGGLCADTRFEGARVSPSLRGCVARISSSNLRPGNLARAVIVGMIEELVEFYRQAESCGAAASVAAGSGNGLRRNAIARLELERRLGMRLRMPPHQEEAAVGAALTAGVASGVYADWNDAGKALFCSPAVGD